jgi:DNA-binding MarR family transcriptional regulator
VKPAERAERARPEVVDAVLEVSRALVAVAARSIESLGDEVTLGQYRALVVLSTHGPQRVADLALALHVGPSTATRLCDRLVRKGLVHRRRTSEDRRGVRVSLAPPGQALVDEVSSRRRYQISDVLGRMPDAGTSFLAAMKAFADAAGDVQAGSSPLGWDEAATSGGAGPGVTSPPEEPALNEVNQGGPNTEQRPSTGQRGAKYRPTRRQSQAKQR